MRVSCRGSMLLALYWTFVGAVFAGSQKSEQLLTDARARMAAGSFDEAIHMLESALENATADDCKPIVEQLRKSYQVAIYQSRQAGRYDQADHYAQNLKLIDSVAGAQAAGSTISTDQADAKPRSTTSAFDGSTGTTVPKAVLKSDLAEPQSLPAPDEVPSVAAIAPPAVAQTPERQVKASLPAEPTAESKVHQFDITEADDAFRARKYEAACDVYQQLFDSGDLPDSRRGQLAYCRAAALVERINKGPADAAEWNAIREEISSIQKIQPDFWFAEYLSDLVRERMKRNAGAGTETMQSGGLMERTANQIRSINPLRKK